ncbi:ribosome small subunit-dependent GTPase A [Streptomyces sp. NPDC005438]|uniref:ribosome small subunit-dependent GTPase A n=1 Tax=Streptomyces sp. NPDC005438 TaxID=3156880 RepID=UPI0033B2E185
MLSQETPAFAPLVPYGWDDGYATDFAAHARRGLTPGRVVRVDRGRVDAVVPDATREHDPDLPGLRTVLADTGPVATSDPLRVPCTGDWVALELGPTRAGLDAVIRALLPRRTAFVRSTSSKRSDGQVLAANVDRAVIAVSLAAELDLGRVERFVSLAWNSGAQPLVLLTKADLIHHPGTLDHLLEDVREVAPGVPVHAVSALGGTGVERLAELFAGGTSVLLGPSGAGKSTLANTLSGRATQRVHAIRDVDGKGRHTTTTRDLLPLPGGGLLIDTPGLRGVGLWGAEAGLSRAFAEIEELAAECRFGDCEHRTEPGCAVREAVDSGELAPRRLESHRKLQRENARLAARTDARLRAERRRETRQRQRQGQEDLARKRGVRWA